MAMRLHRSTIPFFALTGMAAILFLAEVQSFRLTEDPFEFRSNVSSGDLPWLQVSLQAFQRILISCDDAMSIEKAAFQTTKDRHDTAIGCKRIADRTTKIMPTHGLAYLVAARAARVMGNAPLEEKNLGLSVEFSPSEGWLAQRRFAFAAQHPDRLRHRYESDVSTLLSMQSGSELLAEYFVQRPDIRAWVSQAALGASAEQRSRFLNLLQRNSR